MAENINRVAITGNLTRDVELRSTGSGMSVANMRVAVNGRRKNSSGEWEDKPNFLNVTVFGGNADNCAKFLARGSAVAIDGRLDWSEWEKDGVRREQVVIIADTVQFLGSGSGEGSARSSDIPVSESDFVPPGVPVGAPSAGDDDIPF